MGLATAKIRKRKKSIHKDTRCTKKKKNKWVLPLPRYRKDFLAFHQLEFTKLSVGFKGQIDK